MGISTSTYKSVSTCTYMKPNIFAKSIGYAWHFFKKNANFFFEHGIKKARTQISNLRTGFYVQKQYSPRQIFRLEDHPSRPCLPIE